MSRVLYTFGSLAINRASIVQVQTWLGHVETKTAMRYLAWIHSYDAHAQHARSARPAVGSASART